MTRRRKRKHSPKKNFSVDIPKHSICYFKYREDAFSSFNLVKGFLKFKNLKYRIVQHLEGKGELFGGNYNCNTVFLSNYLPEKRRIVAYWDYENELLFF